MLLQMSPKPETERSIALNRRVGHEYLILEEIECGIVLIGSEVKSLRAGRISIGEAYGMIRGNELFLVGAHIPEYPQAGKNNHKPTRERKLLLHRRELDRWAKAAREKGVTIVPMQVLFQNHLVKVRMALVKGKKLYDKRQSEREKAAKRDMSRALGRRR